MRRAIFPGTFDPFTIGHYSVVKRALTFMDEVIIGIGINENKNTYFPIEKREEMIRNLYKDNPCIKVSRVSHKPRGMIFNPRPRKIIMHRKS